VGAANFPLLVAADGQEAISSHAHNVVLQIAAEIGVLGGAIWLWLWLTPALWLWRRRYQLTPWATVAGHAWLAIGVINLFDAYFWVLDAGRLMSMLVLALLGQAMIIVDNRQPSQTEGVQP
jgi:O-antigen ligase